MKIHDLRALLDAIEKECGPDVEIKLEHFEYTDMVNRFYSYDGLSDDITYSAAPDNSIVVLRSIKDGSD